VRRFRPVLRLAGALWLSCSAPSPPQASSAVPSVPPLTVAGTPPTTAPNRVDWPAAERAELVEATLSPTGQLEPLVVAELTRARADGRTLVVYVGASWCEPCTRFHGALKAGLLNSQLRGIRFLEFDLDRHARPLRAAGCESDMIPLFALPTAEGTCGPLRIMGGVKGDAALGNLMPRLLGLIARARTDRPAP
jgi:hypothetical protein